MIINADKRLMRFFLCLGIKGGLLRRFSFIGSLHTFEAVYV
jgi:hypothetical protein